MKRPTMIFVIWSENFDETLATRLIAQFRQTKQKIKLVGLRSKPVKGMYGVALAPDLTLTEALSLADRASCVAVPCHSPQIAHIRDDPRVGHFFRKAWENDAQFVTGDIALENLDIFPLQAEIVTIST